MAAFTYVPVSWTTSVDACAWNIHTF